MSYSTNTINPVKRNALDAFQPHLTESARSDSRTLDGIHIGRGVRVVAVPRVAAGWKRDKHGNEYVPAGYLLPETWAEMHEPADLLSDRVGTPTKWDGIGYQVIVQASPAQVRRLMPILKECHACKKSTGGNHQVAWYAVPDGFCSPLYLSLEFHDKLTKLAAELESGKVQVALYRYDKHNPKGCKLVKLTTVNDEWLNKDERSRVLSKRGKLRQGMSLLDAIDTAAETYREKKRNLNR